MAATPVNRSLSPKYLAEQHKAIRWLAAQGMTANEIATLSWGAVDLADKTIRIPYKEKGIQLNWQTGEVVSTECYLYKQISVRGIATSDFFLHSRIYCHWMFVKERPRSWRKNLSVSSLYSVCEIEQIIGKMDLQFSKKCANIEVSETKKINTIR